MLFFYLERIEENGLVLWALFLSYNFFAFFPQSIIGYFSDSHQNIPLCAIGLSLTAVTLAVFPYIPLYLSLILICLGNAFVHVNGAEVTLRSSDGKLFSSALFVGGGSFGVISGRLLAGTSVSSIYIIFLAVSAIPLSLCAQTYLKKANEKFSVPCEKFRYAKVKKSAFLFICLIVFIVFVRGYMGYGIPTSWNKTTFQSVFLYFSMGIGKALGGLFSDFFGIKKTAILSSVIAVPLLLCGDNHMYISLLGVMFFSMTMSVTLALLVSVLPKNPGLAFGLTTIGLFLGTAPTFFFKLGNFFSNCLVILILTVVCVVIFSFVIRKYEKNV